MNMIIPGKLIHEGDPLICPLCLSLKQNINLELSFMKDRFQVISYPKGSAMSFWSIEVSVITITYKNKENSNQYFHSHSKSMILFSLPVETSSLSSQSPVGGEAGHYPPPGCSQRYVGRLQSLDQPALDLIGLCFLETSSKIIIPQCLYAQNLQKSSKTFK